MQLQWNLAIVVTHGPRSSGCNREVAGLKRCAVYEVLSFGA